ncbi:hypothetical protein D3C86_1797470 [compost metagenome]
MDPVVFHHEIIKIRLRLSSIPFPGIDQDGRIIVFTDIFVLAVTGIHPGIGVD